MFKRLLTALLLFVFLLGFSFVKSLATPLPGAVFTTDSTCSGVDLNHYLSKADIYLDGGPHHGGAAGLSDDYYYVRITDPSGATLLGTSVGSESDTPIHVTDGSFDACYKLWDILIKGSNGTVGYDNTTNPGGEYKVWVSTVSTFNNDQTKTDNFKVEASITIIKHVINDNGGEAVASDFTINVTGENPSESTFPGSESGTTITLDPGDYSIDENSFGGYEKTLGENCSGTISSGQSLTCIITNDDIAPTLTLVKTVVNDNGGTLEVADFPLFVDATAVNSGDTNDFNAGSHTASETNQLGYLAGNWGGDCATDGSITIALGNDYTCTITNDDIQPKLTLIKHIVNNNGGTLEVKDFPLFVDSTSVISGEVNGFDAGSYTASETTQTGYSPSVWSGDCDSDGSITLSVGDDKTCEITNDDISPSLTIVKDADPNDCQNFAFSMTGQSGFSLDDDGGVAECLDSNQPQSKTFNNLSAGQDLTITETLPDAFWSLRSVSCVVTGTQTPYVSTGVTNGVVVNMGLADNVTCTFLNKNQAPTRTLGFWKTHTAFTSSVFTSHLVAIGNNGTHRGPMTISTLFGAYYSNIAKTSTGTKRTPSNQARMQLAWQLITAKLNCAEFGCPVSILGTITSADTAYVIGVPAQMLLYSGQLDSYNNSGDTIVIGPVGKATPKTSQSYANIPFWDTP